MPNKITRKDLLEWVKDKRTVRYHGVLYKARYNGLYYSLIPIDGGDSIKFYHKGRGVFGLESNRQAVAA